VNLILAIPLEVRLVGLFVAGALAGSLANLAVYRLAWHPRRISPWSPPEPGAPPRRRIDCLPILGWLGLRRETALHGPGFWIRPMSVELLAGLGFAWLYWWETEALGLMPSQPVLPKPLPADWMAMLHVQYACHLALIWLMLVGSLIDADEKIIPDTITVPGTLLGLLAAAAYPWSMPTVVDIQVLPDGMLVPGFSFLQLTSPYAHADWPVWLGGFRHPGSLLLGLGCWWLWCVGLMPRSWYVRHGYLRALVLSWARLRRESATRQILVVGAAGSVGIAAVWYLAGLHWAGLLTSLVGMAAGGGLIWLVRIIGTNVLGREAMGFGDVTLVAMIGTFLGWQTCLMVFFLAPFFALGFGLMKVILHSEHEIPYGPFLCMATLVILLRWSSVWHWAMDTFALGLFIPLIVAVCLVLLAVMLGAWRLILATFR
jgi:leader peptidase (prepilin peptidase)/N-methyltransferase